jgi:hypothetical protein
MKIETAYTVLNCPILSPTEDLPCNSLALRKLREAIETTEFGNICFCEEGFDISEHRLFYILLESNSLASMDAEDGWSKFLTKALIKYLTNPETDLDQLIPYDIEEIKLLGSLLEIARSSEICGDLSLIPLFSLYDLVQTLLKKYHQQESILDPLAPWLISQIWNDLGDAGDAGYDLTSKWLAQQQHFTDYWNEEGGKVLQKSAEKVSPVLLCRELEELLSQCPLYHLAKERALITGLISTLGKHDYLSALQFIESYFLWLTCKIKDPDAETDCFISTGRSLLLLLCQDSLHQNTPIYILEDSSDLSQLYSVLQSILLSLGTCTCKQLNKSYLSLLNILSDIAPRLYSMVTSSVAEKHSFTLMLLERLLEIEEPKRCLLTSDCTFALLRNFDIFSLLLSSSSLQPQVAQSLKKLVKTKYSESQLIARPYLIQATLKIVQSFDPNEMLDWGGKILETVLADTKKNCPIQDLKPKREATWVILLSMVAYALRYPLDKLPPCLQELTPSLENLSILWRYLIKGLFFIQNPQLYQSQLNNFICKAPDLFTLHKDMATNKRIAIAKKILAAAFLFCNGAAYSASASMTIGLLHRYSLLAPILQESTQTLIFGPKIAPEEKFPKPFQEIFLHHAIEHYPNLVQISWKKPKDLEVAKSYLELLASSPLMTGLTSLHLLIHPTQIPSITVPCCTLTPLNWTLDWNLSSLSESQKERYDHRSFAKERLIPEQLLKKLVTLLYTANTSKEALKLAISILNTRFHPNITASMTKQEQDIAITLALEKSQKLAKLLQIKTLTYLKEFFSGRIPEINLVSFVTLIHLQAFQEFSLTLNTTNSLLTYHCYIQKSLTLLPPPFSSVASEKKHFSYQEVALQFILFYMVGLLKQDYLVEDLSKATLELNSLLKKLKPTQFLQLTWPYYQDFISLQPLLMPSFESALEAEEKVIAMLNRWKAVLQSPFKQELEKLRISVMAALNWDKKQES